MRKLVSLVLCVVMIVLSLGAVVPASGAVLSSASPPAIAPATTSLSTGVVRHVWPAVFSQTNTGSVRWTDLGANDLRSVELSLPAVFDQAEIGVLIAPVVFGEIDASDPLQANFKGYMNPANDAEAPAPVYMNLYCDMTGDSRADYTLRTEMTAASAEAGQWVNFAAIGNTWQISSDNNPHGISTGSSQTWQQLKADNFTTDHILAVSVYAYRGTGRSALSLNIDDITLGATVYGLAQIQDAIDFASAGDTLVVHPGTSTGQEQTAYVYPEFLLINKAITLKSYDEYMNVPRETAVKPIIQPAAIPVTADNLTDEYAQVVFITASDVVFQGFAVNIDGYLDEGQTIPDTGIIAVDILDVSPAESLPLSNVVINNNTVNIDNISSAWGIEVVGYDGEIAINGNILKIGSLRASSEEEGGVYNGSGIELHECQNVTVQDNNLTSVLYGSQVFGIWATDCASVTSVRNTLNISVDCPNFITGYDGIEGIFYERVNFIISTFNTVTLTGVGNYGYMEGIGLWNYDNATAVFDRAEIVGNTVTLDFSSRPSEVTGLASEGPDAQLYGIWVESGNLLVAANNTIRLTSQNHGQAYLDGLSVVGVTQPSSVMNNSVTLKGQVKDRPVQVNSLSEPGKHRSGVSAAVDTDDIFGLEGMEFNTVAEGYGIRIINCYEPSIQSNTVDVAMDVDTAPMIMGSKDQLDNVTAGASFGMGLVSVANHSPQVVDNNFEVITDLFSGLENPVEASILANLGVSIAVGIYLGAYSDNVSSGALIEANQIVAAARGEGGDNGIPVIEPENQAFGDFENGFWDTLDAAISEALAQAGQIVSQNSAETQSVDSVAQFKVMGLGIVAFNAPGITIKDNDPVIGLAEGLVNSIYLDDYVNIEAFAEGVAYGIGGGILLIQCDEANVSGNGQGASEEIGPAALDLPEVEFPPYGLFGVAVMETNVGSGEINILGTSTAYGGTLCNSFGILVVRDENASEEDSLNVSISGNYALTGAFSRTMTAALISPDDSRVITSGVSQGYSLGIGSMVDQSLISGNTIIIEKQTILQSGSFTDTGHNGAAMGGIVSRAVGIFTRDGDSQILDNIVRLGSQSRVETVTLNLPIYLDTEAISINRSVGIGVAALGNGDQTISGNQAQVDGDYEIAVASMNFESLDQSEVVAIGISFNAGLLLAGDSMAQRTAIHNVTQNQFGADSSMYIQLNMTGQFVNEVITAAYLNIDALILGGQTVFNYNDLGGRQNGAAVDSSAIRIKALDCGLLNLYGLVDARYNYWGDPTGPSGLGQGSGRPLTEIGNEDLPAETVFDWWLSHSKTDLQKDNVGYYGFGMPLEAGWNTLSVPMALEHSRWSDIVAMSELDYEIAYYYDPTQEFPWQQILEDDPETEINESYVVKPLDGIYIKMKTPGTVFFTTGTSINLPTSQLTEGQSWYLVGVTPYDTDYPFTTEMKVDDAFNNLLLTPDGLPGLTGVVSPGIGGQDSWYWTTNNNSERKVQTGKAYWVFMKNPGTLYGFIATPLPALWPSRLAK